MMEKLFFFDLETTGVKYWRNGIHQISGMIVIDGEVKESFDFKVKPYERAEIENEALAIAGVSLDDIADYPPMDQVYNDLCKILSKYVDKFDRSDKFHLVGYNNSGFDNQFLRAFFTQCGDKYFGSWFWADSFDCLVLASHKLRHVRPEMPNFQLRTVAAKLGILVDEEKLHDAQYDIGLTKQIFDIVTN